MNNALQVSDVANAIQLSVAPVLLLASVGALLNVLTSRLSRAVNRYRELSANEPLHAQRKVREEINIQVTRTRLIHWSIVLCTICALLICLVVALMFISTEISRNSSTAIAVLFIGAMVSLVAALLLFLQEVSLALKLMKHYSKVKLGE